MQISNELTTTLAWSMVLYIAAMLGLSLYAHRRVHSVEDFVVAGRRLGFGLALGTLFATWFGAGTLLTAADEVNARGVTAATLDPIGAGLCLIIAGLVFAGPMWRARLTALPELFGRRYSPGVRTAAAVLAIPPYLGWIAAQYVALAGMLNLFFGLPVSMGRLGGGVGGVYTVLGGMWSVTLTDAFQMVLLVVGLGVIAWVVLAVRDTEMP